MAFSFKGFLKGLVRPRVFVPVLVIVAGVIGWRVYVAKTTGTTTTYVTGKVQQGNLLVTAKGSGQVSASDSFALKPKASGTVLSVPVKEGQQVKAGTLIVQLDATDALHAVRDAEASLASSQLALTKLQQPPDSLTLLQSQDAITQAQQDQKNTQDNLSKAYDDGYTSVGNAFLQLPNIMNDLNTIMTGKTTDTGQAFIDSYGDSVINLDETNERDLKAKALASYAAAQTSYAQTFTDYKNSTRYATPDQVQALLDETYASSKSIAEAVKDTKNFLDFVNDTLIKFNKKLPSTLTADQTTMQSDTGTVNTQLSALLSSENTISNDEQQITTDAQTIAEKTASLQKLQAGTTALDLQSAQMDITSRKNALADAQATLANYEVRAPFDGTVANILVKPGDDASGTVATLLAPTLLANISLNEVDVVNVKVGQNVQLSFDALPDLTNAAGVVSQVDPLGTVSQGVVTYAVQIALTNPDPRVKAGMNVSASIVTQEHDNVLIVPSSAVRTGRNGSSVQVQAANGSVSTVPVQTGLSNDTQTEITSGLTGTERIVIRTVTVTAGSTGTPAASTSLIPGLGGAGGTFRGGAGGAGGTFIRTGGGATGGAAPAARAGG